MSAKGRLKSGLHPTERKETDSLSNQKKRKSITQRVPTSYPAKKYQRKKPSKNISIKPVKEKKTKSPRIRKSSSTPSTQTNPFYTQQEQDYMKLLSKQDKPDYKRTDAAISMHTFGPTFNEIQDYSLYGVNKFASRALSSDRVYPHFPNSMPFMTSQLGEDRLKWEKLHQPIREADTPERSSQQKKKRNKKKKIVKKELQEYQKTRQQLNPFHHRTKKNYSKLDLASHQKGQLNKSLKNLPTQLY